MDSKEKKKLSESDICDLFITPAINNAGWDPMTQIRREVTLSPGPVVVRGNMSSRNKKKKKFADYVLSWEPGVPIAIVEAKDNNHTVSHGMQQALGYVEILDVPCAFSSNGDAFASHNKAPSSGEDIETEFPLESFPPPQELWQRYKTYRGIEDDAEKLVVQPYHLDVSGKEPRYYQVEAIKPTEHIWYYEHPYPEGIKSYNKTKPMRFEEFATEIDWWGDEADGFAARVQSEQAWKVPVADIVARNYNLDIKNPHIGEQISHDPDVLLAQYNAMQDDIAVLRGQLKGILGEALQRGAAK